MMNRLRRLRLARAAAVAAAAAAAAAELENQQQEQQQPEDEDGEEEEIPMAVVAELIQDDDDDDDNSTENLADEDGEAILQQQQRQPPGDMAAVVQNNNNDNNNGDDDNNEEVDDIPVLGFAQLRGRSIASISSYLLDMVRQPDRTCESVLTGRHRNDGCDKVVQHCMDHPEEAFYAGHRGRLPLHEACRVGCCPHIIRSLLTANSVGALDRDYRGNTPLHLLFMDFSNHHTIMDPKDIDTIVQMLLEVSTSPQTMAGASNLEGSTPLHLACTTPETMMATSTLRQLITANPICAMKINNRNQTALRLHCQRGSHASVEVAQLLLDANPDAISILDGEDGWAPIHYAAANANLELIRYLVRRIPDAARLRTTKGLTGLHLLCRRQNITEAEWPAMQCLIQADPTCLMQRDYTHQYTPLHLLCQGSSRISLPVLKKLLLEANNSSNHSVTATPDHDHYLPLHHACEMGADVKVISTLLDHYPTAANVLTRKQDSALSLACTCNKSLETVRLLIQANSSALIQKNMYGFAPLHCVCRAYQPRMAIVQALLDACPSSISLQTHAGETPVHLASSNSGAFVGVLQVLTMVQNQTKNNGDQQSQSQQNEKLILPSKSIINKIGNTPCKYHTHATVQRETECQNSCSFLLMSTIVHDACFRGSSFEHIETLAMANPEWLHVCNNGGFTALQILCKNGRIDEKIITTFSRIGGPETFSVVDSSGNTPLHSAMRKDIDLGTVKCLIRAFPDALYSTTIYGDTPLHLACFRHADPDVVQEVALASSSGQTSPVLLRNTASQTPIGIAMDEFRSICRGGGLCCVSSQYRPEQKRAFRVLAALAKILYYGSDHHQDYKQLSLIHACVALHRKNIRLDPAFIRRAIHLYPEEARRIDKDGNTPLHYEASIPVEKMGLLDGPPRCCGGRCHQRLGILRMLLEMYPQATQLRNSSGHFPLTLMIQNGRLWGDEVALALRAFPPALHWHTTTGVDDCSILPLILEKAGKECGSNTLFLILNSRPDIFRRRRRRRIDSSSGPPSTTTK
eukprot:scaffold9951_cov146-Cylindrotheca_fusiformis.AAC.1